MRIHLPPSMRLGECEWSLSAGAQAEVLCAGSCLCGVFGFGFCLGFCYLGAGGLGFEFSVLVITGSGILLLLFLTAYVQYAGYCQGYFPIFVSGVTG